MTVREATCACGQLRVRCDGAPQRVSACHCGACQRRTGSAFGVAAFYARAQVAPQGEASRYTRSSESGHDVTFHFCPRCGSSVYWEPARKPDSIAVAVGAFADPTFPAPSKAAYEQQRHGWVALTCAPAAPD
jgi:hypothetical protein